MSAERAAHGCDNTIDSEQRCSAAGRAPGPASSRQTRSGSHRRRLLEAATHEVATHGFGGARVERISRPAHTVARMLDYHLASTEGRFRAVIEDSYEQLGQQPRA